MEPYAVFDLHCDTLVNGRGLNDPEAAFALCRLPCGVRWAQCTAVFIPDDMPPEARLARYDAALTVYRRHTQEEFAPCRTAQEIETAWAQHRPAAILTVENGSLLCGDMAQVELLHADGVQMLTLTWNGVNEIGSGNNTSEGLTSFGQALIPEMERLGMIVDVSHLNTEGFADVLKVASRPFAASHSNAKAVCGHWRNLADWQLREMIDRSCLIGLNFYNDFLRSDGAVPTPEDLLRHAEHILALGGEHVLALGSDFDGAQVPPWLTGPADEGGLAQLFLSHGYSPELVEKLMYRNALEFWRRIRP